MSLNISQYMTCVVKKVCIVGEKIEIQLIRYDFTIQCYNVVWLKINVQPGEVFSGRTLAV